MPGGGIPGALDPRGQDSPNLLSMSFADRGHRIVLVTAIRPQQQL
jgi:hypothetical protein